MSTAMRLTMTLALLSAGLVLTIAVLVAVVVPAWRGLVAIFAALTLLWIGASFLQTRLHLGRFRAELGGGATPTSRHKASDRGES